jgi:hypothetical protein
MNPVGASNRRVTLGVRNTCLATNRTGLCLSFPICKKGRTTSHHRIGVKVKGEEALPLNLATGGALATA